MKIRLPILLALSAMAWALPARGQSVLVYSPDIPVEVNGSVVEPAGAVADPAMNPANVEILPAGVDVDALGDLNTLSLTEPADIAGVTVHPGDLFTLSGTSVSVDFSASGAGLSSGIDLDAASTAGGMLLLSFDQAFTHGGVVYQDEDLVQWDGAAFQLFFDGSAQGLDPALDLDGAHYETSADRLLLSFDLPGIVGGINFDDDDILAFDRATGAWSLHRDVSAAVPDFRAADVDGVYAFTLSELIFADGFETPAN